MQYLLTQQEYDALTPVKGLQERNEALEVARRMIVSDEQCQKTYYCTQCPIGQIEDRQIRNHICIRPKNWPK